MSLVEAAEGPSSHSIYCSLQHMYRYKVTKKEYGWELIPTQPTRSDGSSRQAAALVGQSMRQTGETRRRVLHVLCGKASRDQAVEALRW
jgi:hypothetical protein